MFEGDSADMCAGKFPLVSMGDEQTVKRAQTVNFLKAQAQTQTKSTNIDFDSLLEPHT